MSLDVIREGVQFRPDAAASFRRMELQQRRKLSVNRTVVPYQEQADLYALRQAGKYPFAVAAPWISNHVYRSDTDGGNAWDTEERGPWLDENGWIADVDGEDWHREYRAQHDQHINDIEISEDNVDQIAKLPGFWIVNGSTATDIRNGVWLIVGGRLTKPDDDEVKGLNSWWFKEDETTANGKPLVFGAKFPNVYPNGNPGLFDLIIRAVVHDAPVKGDLTAWLTERYS